MKLFSRIWPALAAAFCALLVIPAAAQPRVDPNCSDDRGADRCSAEQQRRTRELFGLLSIEEHRDRGDEVRRVLYVDGYGRDLVAIAFVRSPGRDPFLSVHFPRRNGERPPEPLQAPVPYEMWDEIRGRAATFDRELVPLAGQPPTICLHSWVYTVEATEPARANLTPARLRRRTEDACQGGLAGIFAADVQRAALSLFPHCARLDPRQHRNPASQLAACRMLAGDRMAAAEVLNRWEPLRQAHDAGERRRLDGLFAHETVIQWGTERVSGHGPQAAGEWVARLSQSGGASLYVERVEGLAADRVRFTGSLARSVEGGGSTSVQQAPVEMIWVFGPSQAWQVASVTVGNWERARPR